MGGFGPMLGQNHHFSKFAPERIGYATERYANETKRLYGVLGQNSFLVKTMAGWRVFDSGYGNFPMDFALWVATN